MAMLNWLKTHWLEIVAAYTGLVAVASIIVKWTPTDIDNKWLKKIVDFVSNVIALNKTKK